MFRRDLLSRRVKREFKQYEHILRRRKPLPERLADGKALMLLFVLPAALCALAGISYFVSQRTVLTESDSVAGGLMTAAEAVGATVAGGLGILVTIIVFALDIHRMSLPGGGPLPRLFATRRGFLPISAFVLGTIGGAIVVAAFGPYLRQVALERMVLAVSVLALVSIPLQLWLLYQTIHALGRESARTLLTDHFKACHRDSLTAEIERRVAVNLFTGGMRELGFQCNILMGNARYSEFQYRLNKQGRVDDVDFGPIKELASRWGLKTLPSQKDEGGGWGPGDVRKPRPPVFTVLPHMEFSGEGTTVLVWEKGPQDEAAAELLESAFIWGHGESPVPKVDWQDFSEMLKALVRQRDAKGLGETLAVFEETAEDYLRSLAQIGAKHQDDPFSGAYTRYKPPTPHTIELFDLAEVTVQEGDRPCVDALSLGILRLASTAFEEDSSEYFAEVMYALYWLHRLSAQSARFAKDATEATVRRLRSMTQNTLGLYIFTEDDKAEALSHVEPYCIRMLYTYLSLLRLAVETGDRKFFDGMMDLLDDLSEHLRGRFAGADLRSQYDHLLWQINVAERNGTPTGRPSELDKRKQLL